MAEKLKQAEGEGELLQQWVHKERIDDILKQLKALDERKLEIVHRFIKTLT